MAKSARARSTCAAGALSERLRRVKAIRSSGVSGRRGSLRWRDMGHLGAQDHPITIPELAADDPLGVVHDLLRMAERAGRMGQGLHKGHLGYTRGISARAHS